jgi:hypothetical protein
MFPQSDAGHQFYRTPTEDDVAAVRFLYDIPATDARGAIRGEVRAEDESPVFGAHVVAIDAHGITRVGALTDSEGAFLLPFLPAGDYELYAEPLDGPFLPGELPIVLRGVDPSIRRDFHLALADSDPAAPTLRVDEGEETAAVTLRVQNGPARLNPRLLGWSDDGRSFAMARDAPLEIEPGQTRFLAVAGEGLQSVPSTGFRFGGSDLVATGRFARGVTTVGLPFVIIELTAHEGAPPGPRTLYVSDATERATLSGALEVVAR